MLRRTRNTAAAGVALAVLGPAATTQAAPAVPAPRDPQAGRGYHDTEHTRRYYQLARF
jgi:hypothetical protein